MVGCHVELSVWISGSIPTHSDTAAVWYPSLFSCLGMRWRYSPQLFGTSVNKCLTVTHFKTHTRLIRPSMPIPLKSVLGSSPWNPTSPHCLVILDSSLTIGISRSHNYQYNSFYGYTCEPEPVYWVKYNNSKWPVIAHILEPDEPMLQTYIFIT